jgi:DNA polymerase
MRTLHLDFECYSPLDLKAVGVENYVGSPGFAVTVVGWAFDDEPAHSTAWPNTTLPPDVRSHINRGGTVKAWNAAFEWNVLTFHYNVDPSYEQMDCVMQRALAYGLPGKLETAGPALGLAIVKDATARRLMLTMGKPKKDGTSWHTDGSARSRAMLQDLSRYCEQDVAAERALDRVIPPLHPFERKLSLVDARINGRGVLIDGAGAAALGRAALHTQSLYNVECVLLTSGAVQSPGTETAKLMQWLADQGYALPSVTKEVVAKAVDHPLLPWKVRRVLELRQMAAKASVAKIIRMVQWASVHDGRARNGLQFYGAGRTGRWAGRGIQVQNLPRVPKGFKPDDVIKVAQADHTALGLLWGSPMQAISRSLRSLLIARSGHVLVSIDLSQIEARVLAWLAGQHDVLAQFAAGVDIYVNTAARHGSTNRQLGKVLTLACGFGMGGQKFKDTAEKDYGVVMSLSEATSRLNQWRADNAAIVAYWKTLQNAVEASVRMPGTVVNADNFGRVMVRTQKGVTQIRKPNGVKLTYHNMRFEKWGSGLVFDGVNSLTKKWGTERTYGGKLVENIVQSVARDVMAEALVAQPNEVVMTVHDDIVWEVPQNRDAITADMLRQVVENPPAWAGGLPIASEVKISRRYGGS